MKGFLKRLGIERISNNIAVSLKFYYLKILKSFKKVDEADPKTFPIIIISFNQLFYLKQLIFFLQKRNYNNIVIIDNASTYQPLLDYFDEIKEQVSIHKLKRNYGHMVFWKSKEFLMLYGKSYYVVTDADIIPVKQCPEDFLQYFKHLLDKNKEITKVGFSLKLDDIPETNPYKQKVIKWESKFWKNQDIEGNYWADIDTTFALYRPGYKHNKQDFYLGIRTRKPYQAKHGGWHLDIANLTNEQKFYFTTCNESSSWGLSMEGNLKTNLYD